MTLQVPPTMTHWVKVLDAAGEAMPGALVTIEGARGGENTRVQRPASEIGIVFLPIWFAGPYDVSVRAREPDERHHQWKELERIGEVLRLP